MLKFLIPSNDFIGPGTALSLVLGAVALACLTVVYRAYLQRQEDSWAKADKK